MHIGSRAYLLPPSTVVMDKSVIMNTKDDDYEEVSLILSYEQIDALKVRADKAREQEYEED